MTEADSMRESSALEMSPCGREAAAAGVDGERGSGHPGQRPKLDL